MTSDTRTPGPTPEPARPALTAREVEVLVEWLRSDSKSVASEALHISVGTLDTHYARIRNKY